MREKALAMKSDILKALAQPTRLKILELFETGKNAFAKLSQP